jgi:hypothetical protein
MLLLSVFSLSLSLSLSAHAYRQVTLIGLFRDLRGVSLGCTTKCTYAMLFDFLYPSFLPLLALAAEAFTTSAGVTVPLLKLLAELVHNRSTRLQFDCSSPNGILLFRETGKVVVAAGMLFEIRERRKEGKRLSTECVQVSAFWKP